MKRGSGLLLASLIASTGAAGAATFTVSETADLPDLLPGNGFCNVFPQAGPGPCTLRAAIIEANALPGSDTIVLPGGQTYALTQAGAGEDGAFSGDLDITDDLQIQFFASGERPVVDADGIDRVFDVISGAVTFFGFDITGGEATNAQATSGGGVLVRSAAGAVNFVFMRVYGNRANLGGGLYNLGADTGVSASEFYDNIFVGDINETASGSAIRNRGTLAIAYSSFVDNRGMPIKGIDDADGLSDTANAIDNEPQGAGTGSITIVNSTLAGNHGNALNMDGTGSIALSNVTIAGNSIRGIRVFGDGGALHMRDSVVAKNAFADCFLSAGADLSLDRYNMDSDDSCELSSGSSNYPGAEPYLTPPVRRGGLTAVSWPLSVSPMLENGHSVIGGIGCEDDDQYFESRPIDFDGNGNARCDIGAIEMSSDVIFFDPFERL